MSEFNPDDKMPPDIANILNKVMEFGSQARADQIGTQRLELATHIFDILAERFLRKASFDQKLVDLSVHYADALIQELRRPSEKKR